MEAGDELVVVGKLLAPYGIKGWMKVYSFTEPMENLLDYDHCRLQRNGEWVEIEIEAGRPHGKGLVLKLRGVETPEEARLYSNCELAITLSQMPALEAGEFYWRQLEGLKVVVRGEAGEQLLGRVDHLLETGANDVLVVAPCEGSIDRRERLVPWLPERVVMNVDLDAGLIVVDWDPEF
jgi:16S rRNA processing protein RimM